MTKAPEREIRVLANKAEGRIEIVCLSDGAKVYDINFTEEQAVQHARALVDAIEMVRAGKPKIILPGLH